MEADFKLSELATFSLLRAMLLTQDYQPVGYPSPKSDAVLRACNLRVWNP